MTQREAIPRLPRLTNVPEISPPDPNAPRHPLKSPRSPLDHTQINPQPPRKPLSRLEALAVAAISLAVLAGIGNSIAHLNCRDKEGPLVLPLLRPVFGGEICEAHSGGFTISFIRTKDKGWIPTGPNHRARDPRVAHVSLVHAVDPVGIWAGEFERERYTLVNSRGTPVSTESGLHAAFLATINALRPESPIPTEFAEGNISDYSIRWIGIVLDIVSLAALARLVAGIRGLVFRRRTTSPAAVSTEACPAQTTTQATDRDAA